MDAPSRFKKEEVFGEELLWHFLQKETGMRKRSGEVMNKGRIIRQNQTGNVVQIPKQDCFARVAKIKQT